MSVSAVPSGLPAFGHLRPEDASTAVERVLSDNRARLEELLATTSEATWESIIEPLEELEDRLSRAWGPVTHLFGVTSTPEWRKAYNDCLPRITAYRVELSQNHALFAAYEKVAASHAYAALSASRQKVIRDALRDFKLAGVHLPAEEMARFM